MHSHHVKGPNNISNEYSVPRSNSRLPTCHCSPSTGGLREVRRQPALLNPLVQPRVLNLPLLQLLRHVLERERESDLVPGHVARHDLIVECELLRGGLLEERLERREERARDGERVLHLRGRRVLAFGVQEARVEEVGGRDDVGRDGGQEVDAIERGERDRVL